MEDVNEVATLLGNTIFQSDQNTDNSYALPGQNKYEQRALGVEIIFNDLWSARFHYGGCQIKGTEVWREIVWDSSARSTFTELGRQGSEE